MNKRTLVVVDYGIGNLYNLMMALSVVSEGTSLDVILSSNFDQIKTADFLILPGVGAFQAGMDQLRSRDLINPVNEFAHSGKPILGICLGMQLLLSSSEEMGFHNGLNMVSGSVTRLTPNSEKELFKVPHIGWNQLDFKNQENSYGLFDGIQPQSSVYFVHSYAVRPKDPSVCAATTNYGGDIFCSAIVHSNIMGCQFHPERSGKVGLRILGNFLKSKKEMK